MQKLFHHGMDSAFEQVFAQMYSAREKMQPQLAVWQQGSVKSVMCSIAIVTGIPAVQFEETLSFPKEISGIVFHHQKDEIAAV